MEDRISILIKKIFEVDELYAQPIPVEYDRMDLFLPEVEMSAKRLCEYMLNQEPNITPWSRMVGVMHFDGSVEADIFHRFGHKHFDVIKAAFYNKPIENLATFEWQHSTPDFRPVLNKGLEGLIADIEQSYAVHTSIEEKQFLDALKLIAQAIVKWAKKCSDKAAVLAETVDNTEYRNNLYELSDALKQVPAKPARNFYEATLCISFCHAFLPDSVGPLDRVLYPFYKAGIENGTLTEEQVKRDLQDLYIIIQANVSIFLNDEIVLRGGECHFSVGGYDANGNDTFNDFTRLIIDSLLELPIFKPQISFRWTKKTSHEVLRYILDCERKDPNKRIALVNDEPRLVSLTQIAEIPFEKAIDYCMTGCNEVGLTGGIYMGSNNNNGARCVEHTMFDGSERICACKTFDEFYAVFEEYLFSDLSQMIYYEDQLNLQRAKDNSLLSCLFMNGCIKNAKSITRNGVDTSTVGLSIQGLTTSIDSLTIVDQLVFLEKKITMAELVDALRANWRGYESLKLYIKKHGRFFGNNDPLSDEIARRYFNSIYQFLKDKKNCFGKQFLVGNLVGYNEHHKWFGEKTRATPDGRFDGDPISFGIGQTDGKDRKGLVSLLASVAQCDPNHILGAQTVTNVTIDEKLVKEDVYFEKFVYIVEDYFRMGGVHIQLTYVSRGDLLQAKITPDKYQHLRVRVSGFSDYFVRLNEALQDDVIARTQQTIK